MIHGVSPLVTWRLGFPVFTATVQAQSLVGKQILQAAQPAPPPKKRKKIK